MNNAGGYIRLYRKLLDSAVFQNEKVFKVFAWCLLKASHKDHEQLVGHQVVKLKPGQFIYGRTKASQFLKIKPSTLNDCMNTLKNLQIIDIKPNNKFSVITVVNWDFYQSSNAETNNKATTNRQQSDTNNNGNNVNNKNIYNAVVNYLNSKAGTNYRTASKATQRLINARLNEDFTEADFITVIDKKVAEWQGTDMAKYLRPITLFGTKFEGYLNQSVSGTNSNHPEGFEVIR